MGTGTETQGVILCNQIRTVDYKAREARLIESVSDVLTDEVLARAITLLE